MKSLSILALMASSAYRWHIRVIQFVKNKLSPNSQSNAMKKSCIVIYECTSTFIMYFLIDSVYDTEIPVFHKGKRSLLTHREKVVQLLDLNGEESGVIVFNKTTMSNTMYVFMKPNCNIFLMAFITLLLKQQKTSKVRNKWRRHYNFKCPMAGIIPIQIGSFES